MRLLRYIACTLILFAVASRFIVEGPDAAVRLAAALALFSPRQG